MSSRLILLVVLTTLPLASAGCAGADQQTSATSRPSLDPGFVPDTKPAPAARWVDATVPAGTEMPVIVFDRLNSRSSKAGDRFLVQVAEAVAVGDLIAVPAGSTLKGVVVGEKGGALSLRFEEITTTTGTTAGVAARISGGAGIAGGHLEGIINPHSRLILVLEEPLAIKVKQ